MFIYQKSSYRKNQICIILLTETKKVKKHDEMQTDARTSDI